MPEKITDETEVRTTELATVLGVTARRVQQLAQDGTLPTSRKGWFLLADSVQRFLRYSTATPVDEEDQKIEKTRRKSEAQIKASKAIIAMMEADEAKGKMHRSEDVAAMTSDLIFTVRTMLMALPSRLAVDAQAAESAAEAEELIRTEVYAVLNELSRYRYDPERYAERVKQRASRSQAGPTVDDDDEGI